MNSLDQFGEICQFLESYVYLGTEAISATPALCKVDMSAILILERLLDDESVNSKEHLLETASPNLSNVEDRLNTTFDQLVHEISTAWGRPQFNSRVSLDSSKVEIQETESEGAEGEGAKKQLNSVVPSWSNGTARNAGMPKALRLSYWKRPDALSYIVLRTELDLKKNNRPMHYDIVLGSRRRSQESSRAVKQLRQTEEHWMSKVVAFLKVFLHGR